MPLTVSVVVPSKDDADLLRRCLAALAVQTRPAEEIIVVDNGSTDATSAVARAAGARVAFEPEPGVLAASATGYDAARTDIVARLDADCVPGPDWLEKLVSAFADDPTLAAVTGGAHLVDGSPRLRRVLPAVYLSAYYAVLTLTLGHVPLFGSNMAIRRDAWASVSERVHRHDDMVHDDLDLAFHLGEGHTIRYVGGLPMGISARPFGEGRAFVTRIHRGFHTVVVHCPEQFPPLRWTRLAVRAVRARRTAPSLAVASE
jgi:glycosyltransferase involved in cell wall biosynthesis